MTGAEWVSTMAQPSTCYVYDEIGSNRSFQHLPVYKIANRVKQTGYNKNVPKSFVCKTSTSDF